MRRNKQDTAISPQDDIARHNRSPANPGWLINADQSCIKSYCPSAAVYAAEMVRRMIGFEIGSKPFYFIQAVYVPADDLTDPAPATTFSHLDATTVLNRKISELGIYPAVDPLDSTSRILSADIVGAEHYNCAQRVKLTLQRYKELQDIIAILGMDELSDDDKLVGEQAAADMLVGICDAREVRLPRTGHMFRFTHPDLYGHTVNEFIDTAVRSPVNEAR